MESSTLGKTGRIVSRIGFGGAPAGFRNYVSSFDPESNDGRNQLTEAIRTAFDEGITYFDTAPGYGEGLSEQIYGEALADIPRDQFFLATKVGVWSNPNVRESLEKSLTRLNRDSIDLLQIHGTNYSPQHAEFVLRPGGMLDQMEALREEGLIRHIGFTGEAINRPLLDLIDSRRFDVLQINYNFCAQQAADTHWKGGPIYQAESAEMGIVTMRSSTSGAFQRWMAKVRPEDDFNWHAPLLHFVLSNPMVDVALVGMRTAEEVRSNVAIASDPAGRIDLAEITQARL